MKITFGLWDCWDDRLPGKKDVLVREPPDRAFLESIKEIQLQPIAIGYTEKLGYKLMFGNKRLLAIRQLQEAGEHNGKIRVSVFEGVTMEEIHRYAVAENSQRSDNPIAQFVAIRELLKVRGATYASVAEATHLTQAAVKHIEKTWSGCPTWAINGALAGKMAMSTALLVAKKPVGLQGELKKVFQNNDGLTAAAIRAQVEEIRTSYNEEVQAQIAQNLPGVADGGRKFFTRAEIEPIWDYIVAEQLPNAKQMLGELLGYNKS